MVNFINYITEKFSEVGKSENEVITASEDELNKYDIGFDKEYKITYLPEGMRMTDYNVSSEEIYSNFYGKDGCRITYIQETKKGSINLNTEGTDTSTISINGYDALLAENSENIIIAYQTDKYTLTVESYGVSKEEMIKVATSIK